MSVRRIGPALLWLCVLAGCGQKPDSETISRLAAADAAFHQAQSDEEFIQVAARYQEVLDTEFVTAQILYNQANAWARGNENGRAIAAYLRAQQLNPRDEKLAANLQLVRNRIGQSAAGAGGSSLTETLLVLNTFLSAAELSILTSAALAAALLCSVWQTVSGRRQSLRLCFFLWATFVLLAASVSYHWYQQRTPSAVVVSPAMAFQGPSETYDSAFEQELQAGLECVVLGTQGEWCNVSIPGAGEAWLPQRELQIIR
ncbi:MAG: hypothetical protein NXI04_14380 [Planctomycetaceae bacterium]|nr:hypothetical protein [Planctomycetaceae bacterium]